MDNDGMIFFSNKNDQPRLCIPNGLQNFILQEAHESPLKSAHAGPEHLWQSLSLGFYWKRMKVDIVNYCRSCNVCQKMKTPNFTKFGMLIPNPILSWPYQSVTKHASFIPTTTGLDSEGFTILFFKHIVCHFSLPESIVTDRDLRWTFG